MRSRFLSLLVVTLLAGCAQSLYQQWGQRMTELTKQGGRVDDVSLLLGNPPSRCDSVAGATLGIGASVDAQKLVVGNVIPDGPAAQAGLRSGDVIRSVAGHSVVNVSPQEARAAFLSNAREGQPLEIGTDRGTFSVVPRVPKREQCYWDVQGGQVSRAGAYVGQSAGYASGSSNQRFFRASCRVSDGYLSTCEWNWQQ